MAGIEGGDRVQSSEHLRQVPTLVVQLEGGPPLAADQAMMAAGETHHVGLVTVSQPGLGDPLAELQVPEEPVEVVPELVFQGDDLGREDGSQQERTVARLRLGGKVEVAQGDPAGGSDGPGVTYLELGEDHCSEGIPTSRRRTAGLGWGSIGVGICGGPARTRG